MTTPKPRRRWLQFRLRTLLLVMAVLCVPLAWVGVRMNQKRQERAAVAAIQELGGYVGYDWEHEHTPCKGTPPGPAWLRAILGDDVLADVATVSFGISENGHLADLDSVHLHAFRRLRTLCIWGDFKKNVMDSDLTCLRALTDLEILTLVNVRPTDAGMSNIKAKCRLTHLTLAETEKNDSGQITFRLDATQVTLNRVAELQEALPNCKVSWQ